MERGELYEEPRKRVIDVCCLQDVRWRGQCVRMLGMTEKRNKLRCLEKEMESVVWESW